VHDRLHTTWFQPPTVPACTVAVVPPSLGTGCRQLGPLANTFVNVTNIIKVASNSQLNSALSSLSKPTMILVDSGTYTLDRIFYVAYDLCIEVMHIF